jgi:GrpB-like predicted nucleotidyltransferase (UPF0157 family)/mannose-6-phosphate isomerase-like protein (cupin superfamily)
MIIANGEGTDGEAWFLGPWNSGLPAAVSFGARIGTDAHVHDEMFELYLVVSGSARIRVRNDVYTLHAGNIAVVEPGESHAMLDGTDDYRHFVIQTPFVAGDKRLVSLPDHMVEVVAYTEEWASAFESEASDLRAAVGDAARSIEHVGSTAVPSLSAKPTIDILLVVNSAESFLDRLAEVEALGYDYRPDSTKHLFLRKVANGQRTHHLHVVVAPSPEIDDYRLFRDALRSDAALRQEYEAVKLSLATKYAADRGSYVNEKSQWVDGVMARLRGDRTTTTG